LRVLQQQHYQQQEEVPAPLQQQAQFHFASSPMGQQGVFVAPMPPSALPLGGAHARSPHSRNHILRGLAVQSRAATAPLGLSGRADDAMGAAVAKPHKSAKGMCDSTPCSKRRATCTAHTPRPAAALPCRDTPHASAQLAAAWRSLCSLLVVCWAAQRPRHNSATGP
jgi:hypothetical protein